MNILLAIDGSDASVAAIRAVQERPWPTASVVRVFMVVEQLYPPPAAPWTFSANSSAEGPVGVRDLLERLLAHARDETAQVAASLQGKGLRVETEAVVGVPRQAIVATAADWHADLIILGSHGRTGIKRWLLGSVAESVVRHAPCSVEVARTRVS
jgi:nucleotide-binding universal stress UspA family protein